jgi:hypothetical protein
MAMLGVVAPVNAATIQPYAATGCSSNVCLYLSTPLGGTVYIQAWARSTTFSGYFKLQTPYGSFVSSTNTWLGGKGNFYQWSGLPAVVGQYCVSGYNMSQVWQGTACNNIQ